MVRSVSILNCFAVSAALINISPSSCFYLTFLLLLILELAVKARPLSTKTRLQMQQMNLNSAFDQKLTVGPIGGDFGVTLLAFIQVWN